MEKIIYFCKNNISKTLLGIVFLLSFVSILLVFQEDILVDHDLAYAFGRKFFFPEHGRYIATFTNHILTENLPEIFNIHPNDFQPIFINPLKAFFAIVIFTFFTGSFFIFRQKQKPIVTIAFVLTYSLIFLSIFNANFALWLGNEYQAFFNYMENTVFWEYPMTFFIYIPFWSIFIYFETKGKIIPKNLYILTLILAFFICTSVEPINDAVFTAFGLYAIYLFAKNKFKLKNTINNNKQFFGILAAGILGLIAYYINPEDLREDHQVVTSLLTYQEYLTQQLPRFIEKYTNFFFIKNSVFLIIPFLLCLYIKFSKNFEDEKGKNKLILLTAINILGYLIFFASVFIIGFCFNYDKFWFEYTKWANMYAYSCLFFTLILAGYAIDQNKLLQPNAEKIKAVGCLLILVIFSKVLIFDNYQKSLEFTYFLKDLKKQYYTIEKLAVSQTTTELYLPISFSEFIGTDNNDNCWWLFAYIRSVHPDVIKTKIVFSDAVDENCLTKDEEQNLKFSNLLRYKRFRNKKDFNSFRPKEDTKIEI